MGYLTHTHCAHTNIANGEDALPPIIGCLYYWGEWDPRPGYLRLLSSGWLISLILA